jgi:hypothetical protein
MSQLIERIRKRCEEIGDCWEWQGALQQRSRTPVMRSNGNNRCVRRVIAEDQGHNIEGKIVTYKCGNHLCCNPDHLQVMTKTALQKRTNKNHVRYMSLSRRQRVAAARRNKSKLTSDQVQAIRDDTRPQRAIATSYGISQTTVSRIKRGEIWRNYTNPFIHLL